MMTNEELIKKLKANAVLSGKQIEQLQEMDEAQLSLVKSLVDALQSMPPAEEKAPESDPEKNQEDEDNPIMNEDGEKYMSDKNLDDVVANKVAEHLKRKEIQDRLVANEKNTLSQEDMKGLSVNQLEKIEKALRPADYSGQGGLSAHNASDSNVYPMTMRKNFFKKGDK